MEFQLRHARPVLERTPVVLRSLLHDLHDEWTSGNEGPNTWSPFDVAGHLIHGERADWIPRVEHILQHGDAVAFPPFDREAMLRASVGHTLADLLDEFASLRQNSLDRLDALGVTDADLTRTGRHPEFGVVTLGQHLSTWVVHDLTHLNQTVRVMAKQYGDAVGPWRAYLSVLK